jgi:hypothetical protein
MVELLDNLMSYEQDYFPPKGSKYAWLPKPLNSRPWHLTFKNFCVQHEVESYDMWPLSITATVDLIDGNYTWVVNVIDWKYNRHNYRGAASTAIDAIKEAERVADDEYERLVPD